MSSMGIQILGIFLPLHLLTSCMISAWSEDIYMIFCMISAYSHPTWLVHRHGGFPWTMQKPTPSGWDAVLRPCGIVAVLLRGVRAVVRAQVAGFRWWRYVLLACHQGIKSLLGVEGFMPWLHCDQSVHILGRSWLQARSWLLIITSQSFGSAALLLLKEANITRVSSVKTQLMEFSIISNKQ